ncbi:MAG TPA: OmpH family outer membrane protein [Pyrinomonadaceae bacterium]|nr:OmpH family outer membrane protein [Pyrinomonadaceae bacterium]
MKLYESFSKHNRLQARLLSVCMVALAIVCATFWSFGLQPSQAQQVPTRIAVIDVQKVLTQSTAGRAATAKLKTLQDARMSRAKAMDEEMRKLNADLAGAGVTPTRRADLERQIADKRISMQRFAEDADKEIGQARDTELLALEARIKPVVDSVGKEMGLAAIFNKFQSGLVYANDSIDVTEAVITRFNAGAPSAAVTPARP